jgi:plasmid maintenance system antidote protein VapI
MAKKLPYVHPGEVLRWMGMQAQYDIERAADTLARELKRIAPAKRAAA